MSELAKVTRLALRGMITFRGDVSSARVKKAIKAATGAAVPKVRSISGNRDGGVAWMSPDELLLMVPYGDVQNIIADLSKALVNDHVLIADVSDARAVFRVEGVEAAQVLARVCPVDLHKDSFDIGEIRRTRMAQVAAAFWRDETGFEVICFRSVADYVEALLQRAAQATPVGALGGR